MRYLEANAPTSKLHSFILQDFGKMVRFLLNLQSGDLKIDAHLLNLVSHDF